MCEESASVLRPGRVRPATKGNVAPDGISAGAYGFVMASNYNTRPFATEVLVNGKNFAVVRERQTVAETWTGEKIAPWLKR